MEKDNKLSLCWFCGKSTNRGCSWSKSFTPVEGWTAIRRDILNISKKNTSSMESYRVLTCPEYKEG